LITEIILASASPRREQLLKQIGLVFRIIPSEAAEDRIEATLPEQYVQKCALAKAIMIRQQVNPSDIVIGADTVVVLDGIIYGKPCDAADARRMLASLAGRTHSVWSGLAVVSANGQVTRAVETKVTLSELSSQQIERYVDSGEPMDKAGAYAIQGLGAMFVERVNGCYYNVVGLPLQTLTQILATLGIVLP
jgi:septum formation protein